MVIKQWGNLKCILFYMFCEVLGTQETCQKQQQENNLAIPLRKTCYTNVYFMKFTFPLTFPE